jgi:cobalt/nickel transport protein
MTTQSQDQAKRYSLGIILLGVALIILLAVIPLALVPGSQFGGSDGAGSNAIAQIAPDYNSEWIGNLWTPPGSETESMLFALQATAGGILIGYFFGYLRGRKQSGS